MIIKIIEKPYSSLKNLIRYNEKESKEGIPHGELLSTNLFGESWEERYEEFSVRLDQSKKNPILHIPIRLAPKETLSNDQFVDLAITYMKKMGLNPETFPYQLVRHHDKPEGEHVHLLVSKTSIKGDYWNPKHSKKLSSSIRQELEKEYNLITLGKNTKAKDKTINEVNMFAYGGKNSTKAYAKEKISSLLSKSSNEDKMDIGVFIHSSKSLDIHPIFNLQNEGERIAGVSFFVNSPYGSHTIKGSQIECSWNDIKSLIAVYPEDKNFLATSNRLSLEQSLATSSTLPKDLKLKNKLLELIILTSEKEPTNNFIESIKTLRLKPTTRKALNNYLLQYEKGNTYLSPLSYANELLVAKASNLEYSLFEWEKRTSIKDPKVHIQAAQFLLNNKENHKALSWIIRYPPVLTKNISFKEHLECFDYYQNQGKFNRLRMEQKAEKESFCDTFNIQGSNRRRFLNTPLSTNQIKLLHNIQDNANLKNTNEGIIFVQKTTESYSTFLKEKIGEVCMHAKASPITAETLYSKFLFTIEKNDLNHTNLYAFHHLTTKLKPSELVKVNFDNLPEHKFDKIKVSENNSFIDFMSHFFSKLGDLPNEPSYEPRETEEIRKRKKRKLRL